MLLKSLKINGFKSFAKSTTLDFSGGISAVVGPNGSGKSNVVEAIAWVLGEQSFKSLRGKKGQDLIFNGSLLAPKTNRASVVLSFVCPVRNEELSVSRAVYRDGANEYSLNNLRCRLKDIVDFLGKAGLSTSRHHIISQGEADRILSASLSERREMIEDALGLRVFQIKRDEGRRKLERTKENMLQVQTLQNEIQPHLRFLKKQVDKADKTAVLKEKLEKLYSSYFSKLEKKFKTEVEKIILSREQPKKELLKIQEKISGIEDKIASFGDKKGKDDSMREEVNLLERDAGRYEAMISQAKTRIREAEEKGDNSTFLDFKKTESFLIKLEKDIEKALGEEQIDKIKIILNSIKKELDVFSKEDSGKKNVVKEKEVLQKLERGQEKLLSVLRSAKEKEYSKIKEKENSIDLERELHRAEIKSKEIQNALRAIDFKESEIMFGKSEMEKDLREAETVLKKKVIVCDISDFSEDEIEKDWRSIERTKIRLEESGNIGEEVQKEYEEMSKRDEFLSSELGDLEKSAASLRELIQQMEEKINVSFKDGVAKINEGLERFFNLMFGGGKAELRVMDDGIDILVNLPRKKISSLSMLSGGERALASIALLFAVSQVNPPPFLILDETDAALDESNSRKYAKMLKDLGKSTQLVLVTHNRETMEVSKILYGVTMDGNGVSRLLSIKLEEAEQLTS